MGAVQQLTLHVMAVLESNWERLATTPGRGPATAPTRKYSSSAKSRVHLGRQQTLLTIHLRCSCAACSVVSKPEAYANQNHQQKSISKSLQRTMPKSEKGRASKRLISSTKCLRKDNARISYDLAGFRTEQRHTPELH